MHRTEPPNNPVTAKDIGRALGLSQPTVSRILAGAEGYRVSPETRRRVMEAAERMGYRPNAVARSLRRRRTNIVGFYTGYGNLDARNAFLAEVIGALQRAADANRLDLLLHGVFRGTSTEDIYSELVDGRIDGLFLHTHQADPLAAKLAASTLPVVAIADAVPGIPSVVGDDEGGTRQLIEHLREKGHECIGYVRPVQRFASVELRYATFQAIAQEYGATAVEMPTFDIHLENAETVLENWRTLPQPPTAVCCWNDLTAFNLIYHCKVQGIRVPEDLAIVGFDGLYDPRLMVRPLTTIRANWPEITEKAMEYLIQQINRSEEAPPALTSLPARLLPGDTT